MIRMFFWVVLGVALIAAGCVIIAGNPSGGTLLMGIAALVGGAAACLRALRSGGRHER